MSEPTTPMAPAADDEAGKLHFEDLETGQRFPLGPRTITRDEIVAYASAFDPQPIHLDDEAAEASIVGGLCASGWHTCGIVMRMLAEDLLARTAGLGANGVEEVRFLKPVRPGDTLAGMVTLGEKRLLRSRPGVGVVGLDLALGNQDGVAVMSWRTHQFVRCRKAGGPQ